MSRIIIRNIALEMFKTTAGKII